MSVEIASVQRPPVDIVVTGKIGNSQVFRFVMDNVCRMVDSGVARRVVFSGWHVDLQEHAALFQELRARGVLAIDNGETLPLRSYGNFFDQMKTLAGALNHIEDGAWVLKLRTDLLFYDSDATIRNLVETYVGLPANGYDFLHRIWIPFFSPRQAFFMADHCYMGRAGDLRRFVQYDAHFEAQGIDIPAHGTSSRHVAAASPEIRLWIAPFLHRYPLLRAYLDTLPYTMNGHATFRSVQDFQLHHPLHQEFLALYWDIVDRVFQVGPGKYILCTGQDHEGRLLARASAPDNYQQDFIADAESPSGIAQRDPAHFSNCESLRRFLHNGAHPARPEFAAALVRAREHVHTPGRYQAFQAYLTQLQAVARASFAPE